MKKRSAGKTSRINDFEITNQNVQPENGKFTFHNGDVYDGEYKINYDRFFLIKQGRGTYATENFDIYHGEWDNDTFANADIHIKYNNDAQYRGRIDSNGAMNGLGTYIFPDSSSIEAVWINNIPTMNIIYRDPFGFAWIVEEASTNSISFSAGNHFWNDMLSDPSSTHSESSEYFDQSEEN